MSASEIHKLCGIFGPENKTQKQEIKMLTWHVTDAILCNDDIDECGLQTLSGLQTKGVKGGWCIEHFFNLSLNNTKCHIYFSMVEKV